MNDTNPTPPDEGEMLLAFVRARDVACPLCGYNLRDLTRPTCPECRQALRLCVGAQKAPVGALLLAVAPGFFSGIAACLLAIPIVVSPLAGGGPAPPPFYLIDAFGFLSGAAAFWLAWKRHSFLRLRPRTQWKWAVVVWSIHVAAFLVVVVLAWLFG